MESSSAPRKASRKAMEEISRETQRMARNMQLAHEARTKKKIGKDSLFARFNYQPESENLLPQDSSSSPAASHHETPPTSPIAHDDIPLLNDKPAVDEVEPSKVVPIASKPKAVRVPILFEDSDDDLEIVDKPKTIFDRLPRKIPMKKKAKPSITSSELQVSLLQRARQQAAREREERLQILRDRGVIVQTAEEREKEKAEIEDLLAKARREGAELTKIERKAAKANGDEEGADDEGSEDEDWEDEELDDELSGSESERESVAQLADVEASEDESDEEVEGGIEAEAEAEGDLETDIENDAADEDEDEHEPTVQQPRRNRTTVLSDDDESDIELQTPAVPRTTSPNSKFTESPIAQLQTPAIPRTDSPTSKSTNSPIAPPSVLRSATKTFIPGLTVAGPAGLGLTQIFAGTMDDSQPQSQSQDYNNYNNSPIATRPDSQMLDPEQDSLAYLRDLPGSDIPVFDPTLDSQDVDVIPASQPDVESQAIHLDFSQDVGFQATPIKGRFAPPSTIETVVLEEPVKKGRLVRRSEVEVSDTPPSPRKVARAPREEVDTAAAKELVQEQADESEDEYAGLGGHSDDDDDMGAEDEYAKEIINDEEGHDADEREIAAFYAEKDRQNDEKAVEKLFRDITTGNLRRKRGNDLDLEDSDSDGEARRRKKQREFAKMRKALLGSDERIGKMAENPKSMAFLRAIEDHEDQSSSGFLDPPPPPTGTVQVDLRNTQAESDSETEETSNTVGIKRRTVEVKDRLQLGRQSSSLSSSGGVGARTRVAFSTSNQAEFKVPALLRRATTSSSSSSMASDMSTMATSSTRKGSAARKSGGIHFAANKVREGEKRRSEKRIAGAEARRKAVGGLFRQGGFS